MTDSEFVEAVEKILIEAGCERCAGSEGSACTALHPSDLAPGDDLLILVDYGCSPRAPFYRPDPEIGWFGRAPGSTPREVACKIAEPWRGNPWADRVLAWEADATPPASPDPDWCHVCDGEFDAGGDGYHHESRRCGVCRAGDLTHGHKAINQRQASRLVRLLLEHGNAKESE